MPWEAWTTLGVIALIVVALARHVAGPDVILLGGLALLVLLGVVGAEQAVTGFGNPGLMTVAVLFVVAGGLTRTGAMGMVARPLLGQPRTVRGAQLRLMLPTAGLSAFLNNTPIVAMFMPLVHEWARQRGISASKLFIPLSYAAIVGGTCTLIGTSTNLVVNGLLISELAHPGIGMFELAWVGVPVAVVAIGYLLLAGHWLLPDRRPPLNLTDDPRQYTVEMVVEAGSPLAGQSIEAAGLRHLPGLYLAEIDRDGEVLPAVGPEAVLRAGDRLVFVGIVESVRDLRQMRGLKPATDQVFKLDSPQSQRCLLEAVVSDACPLVGKTVREGRFRSTYNAVIIAVAREGQRLEQKIGDIVLKAGDTLLLEAHPSFADQQRNSRDFFLVSPVEGSSPPRYERAWLALAVLGLMVVVVTAGWMSMLAAALAAAVGMIALGCCTGTEARRSVDWQVLIVIGAALGLGQALQTTGAAAHLAQHLIALVGTHPWVALLLIYIMTSFFTELITNNGAAVLVFPIARATAESLEVSVMPFAISIMIAASASFATPIGYQTNLMVYGPGGYRYGDYLRVGLPLNLMALVVTVSVVPWVWGFGG